MRRLNLLSSLLLIFLAGCQDTVIVPTLANPEAVATGFVLTENAPPTGYETVSFPKIDANLEELPGWRYEMEFEFTGRFASTAREASARTRATVTYQQLNSSRRVVATVQQNLQGEGTLIRYEGVRLGQDAFLVRDGNCLSNAGDDAATLADLSAGDFLGGVDQADSAIQKATINGELVWRYAVLPDAMRLPNVGFGENSRILSLDAELWISPEYDAVVRYYATMEVENVTIFDSSAPVSGTVLIRYDLFAIGELPNINVPNGC